MEEKEEKYKPGVLMTSQSKTAVDDLKKAIEDSTKYNKGAPISSYKLTYDAPTSQLEPIYFWIHDFIKDRFVDDLVKVTDNFTSSPGSGHFAEMGMRASRMQDQGMKIFGMINQVVKTILNLVYDLKEFEIRLEHYKRAKEEDKSKREEGLLALKQIWLDNVDMKRGRGSIHQMSYEMGFTTLRELFMISETVDDIKNNEIANEQVKRILIPRMSEFLMWREKSEKELEKRFKIEKSYLKSEVESLKLYTSWAKPYLKAAQDLRQNGFGRNPALVSAFNTTMFDLVLFGKKEIKPPEKIKGYEGRIKRKFYACYVVGFTFRGFPQKVTQQHYGFGGRVDMTFDCYALNEDEIKLIDENLKKKDVEDAVKFVQDATDESLEQLKEDLDRLLIKEEDEEKDKDKKKQDDINPFSALVGLFKKKEKKKEKDKEKIIKNIKEIKKDNFFEEATRNEAKDTAMGGLYAIYDIYKKAHGMASSFEPFENINEPKDKK